MTTSELRSIREELLATVARVDALIEAAEPLSRDSAVDVIGMDRTRAIEWVLQQRGEPMRPVEIWAELRRLGRTKDPKMEVQVTTYDLWQRGRIGKVGRGLYTAQAAS